MEQRQTIHLYGESVCLWTIPTSDFRLLKEKKTIKSPLYCAKEFANLQWGLLFRESELADCDLMFFSKKCTNENASLKLTFTFDIPARFIENVHQISKTAYVEGIKQRHLASFYIDYSKKLPKSITLRCTIRLNKKHVELFTSYEFLFLKEKFSDVVLLVGGRKYPAHKVILSTISPVFQAMFSCEMKENILNEVEIDDIEPEVIKEFLSYLYKGDISNWDKFVHRLLPVACKYQVDNLKKKCELVLERNLSAENVIKTLVVSEIYLVEHLKEKCISLINNEFKRIGNQKDYQNLGEMYPHLLIDIFNASRRKINNGKELVQFDNSKLVTINSGLWSLNTFDWEATKFPSFEIDDFTWFFEVKNAGYYTYQLQLSVYKREFTAFNCSLKFEIICYLPERILVTVEVPNQTYSTHKLTTLSTNLSSTLTIFWKVKLIPKTDNVQNLYNVRNSVGYDFFFLNPDLSDLIFHSGDKQFPAHKLILASKNETFRKMFLSQERSLFGFVINQNETREEISSLRVDEVEPKIVEKFLMYIYKGEVASLDEIAEDLYIVAKKYEMCDLKLMCENALLKNLNSKNVISTLVFAEKNEVECLKDACIFFIIEQSINFEDSKTVDRKLVMEMIDAVHTGERPQQKVRNVKRDILYSIRKCVENIFWKFGQDILQSSWNSYEYIELIIEEVSGSHIPVAGLTIFDRLVNF